MNEFKIKKGLIVNGSGSTILNVQGSQGQLFSVTDQLSGSLFAVKDISGIPIMEVYSDNRILMGTFNNEAIIVSGSRTGMGIATPAAKLHISGAISDTLLIVSSSARTALFISGSGNVGIGVNNPTNALDVSGSTKINGNLTVTGSITATTGFTGSLLGTASFATTASYALSSAGGGSSFPFTGSAVITGSLVVTGSITATTGFSGSFSGSFFGNGAGLTGVTATADTTAIEAQVWFLT